MLSNIVISFYIFLLLFIWVVPVDSSVFVKSLSTLVMVSFLAFYFFGSFFGARIFDKRGKNSAIDSSLPAHFSKKLSNKELLLVVLVQILLVSYAGGFYTGFSFAEVVTSFASGHATYNSYQEYFSDNELSSFSLSKIPAILALAITKITFIIYYTRYFIFNCDSKLKKILKCLILCFPVVLLSVYRGTSFEIFEVIILTYILFMANHRAIASQKGYNSVSFGKILVVFVISLVGLYLYNYNVQLRYEFDYQITCHNEFCLDNQHLVFQLNQALGLVFYKLSSYFYFGLDYLSRLSIFISDNPDFAVNLLLPFQAMSETELSGRFLCELAISCGPTWSPFAENLILKVGLVFFIPSILIFSALHGYFFRSTSRHLCVENLALYFFLSLIVMSLPVGNFLFVSSSNIISVIFFVFYPFISKAIRNV